MSLPTPVFRLRFQLRSDKLCCRISSGWRLLAPACAGAPFCGVKQRRGKLSDLLRAFLPFYFVKTTKNKAPALRSRKSGLRHLTIQCARIVKNVNKNYAPLWGRFFALFGAWESGHILLVFWGCPTFYFALRATKNRSLFSLFKLCRDITPQRVPRVGGGDVKMRRLGGAVGVVLGCNNRAIASCPVVALCPVVLSDEAKSEDGLAKMEDGR